jgi:Holliday junction DNA helicase RuvA
MIAFIKGAVDEVGEDFVIVEVSSGVGYKVSLAANSPIIKKMKEGEEVKLYTSQYFRENDQGLFGFETARERNFYELLITVSGVGPKLASTLLAHIKPQKLAEMIINNNIEGMTEVPGIGTKMAERLVVDLRDRVFGEDLITKSEVDEKGSAEEKDRDYEEEMMFLEEALKTLGFSSSEIKSMRDKAENMFGEGGDVEEVLRRLLGRD